MHKMYRVKTNSGDYAVKLLNPVVMQREDVMNNFRLAENLEAKLQAAGLPVVPALEFNDKKMQGIDNQYFYVFHWVNGKSLNQKQIKETHCEIIGKIAFYAMYHEIYCYISSGGRTKMNHLRCLFQLKKELKKAKLY